MPPASTNPYANTVPRTVSQVKKTKPTVSFDSTVTTTASSKSTMDPEERSKLKAEILALGGDEDDLKLIQDLDSDSEVEGELDLKEPDSTKKAKGDSWSKDLKQLFKSLDFAGAGAAQPELNDDDDEESSEQTSGPEDDEEESSEEEEEEIETGVVIPVAAVVAPQESKREREDRKIIERDAAKVIEKAEKALIREEKSIVKLPVIKSVWVVEPSPQWYSTSLPSLPSSPPPTPALIGTLHSHATTLLTRENTLYATSLAPRAPASAPPPPNGLSKADQVFIQQILSSGTSADKLSALLLLISSAPLHTMSYLDMIVAVCKKKSREESGRAVRGVVEWWRSEGGGCPTRKLKAFGDQEGLGALAQAWTALQKGGKSDVTKGDMDRCLIVWAFEDWLKKWFFEVLKSLEQMSVDPLPHPRTLAVVHLSNLLRDKPEQEGNILRLLVNKLGDSQKSIASKTSHHLLQILQFHPGMTPILVREVSSLILRPALPTPAASSTHTRFNEKDKKVIKDNGQDHARYYGVITLNQVMLTRKQADVAAKMIEVYFEIFGDILGRLKEDDEDEAKELGLDLEKSIEGKKVFEKKKFVKGKKKAGKNGAAAGGDGDDAAGEGEVSENDSKLVAAVLTGVNRAFPFATIDDAAFKKRLDTLFRITHTGTFNVSIQALMLIYHVSAAKRAVSDRFYRALYTSLFDPRLANSSKQALYLNLVFKAMKQDTETKRVTAFVKRLVQVMLGMEVTFILGSIWIVGELMATVTGLRVMLTEAETPRLAITNEDSKDDGRYDGKKREPQFANAQNSCLWELVPLLEHYHPSVVLHANQLLTGQPISAASDLEQHSLNHFLDRFVYRDVKKHVPTKGSSMMQSGVGGQDGNGRIVMKKGPARGEDAMVNSEGFRNKGAGDVPVDQLFFHKYFSTKTALSEDRTLASKKRKSRKNKGDDSADEDDNVSENESIEDLGFSNDEAEEGGDIERALKVAMKKADEDSDEEDKAEEEIWKAMKASMPKRGNDDDIDELDEDDDSDEDDAQFDYTDSEEEEEGEEGGVFQSAFADEEKAFDDDQDDGDDLMEDEGDIFGSDEDIPMFGSDEEEDDDEDVVVLKGKRGKPVSRKGESGEGEDRKKKKRKLGSLPMFATAEDYAHMLGSDDDDDE